MNLLRRNRLRINQELKSLEQRKFLSPASYGHHQVTMPAVIKYVQGKCIDIGCGHMPYKDLIMARVTHYDSLDRESRVPGVTYIGDVQNMHMLREKSYNSAICFEVLEHVPDPMQAITEIARILQKDGILILSVPHLSRLHEEPYDFFRYTKYGLQALLENAGFHIVEIQPRGGLFSFLGQQFSTMFVCCFWHIPILKHLIFFVNKWLCVLPCYAFDRAVDRHKLFALGYTCVARKV
jgi:SAM-dependent methyltransferase